RLIVKPYFSLVASAGWPAGLPFSVAVFLYLSPSLVMVVVQPESQVIAALFPSSFHLPAKPPFMSPWAVPPSESQIVKGLPCVSVVFHLPTKPLIMFSPVNYASIRVLLRGRIDIVRRRCPAGNLLSPAQVRRYKSPFHPLV